MTITIDAGSWPAWVQAFGALLALVVAILVPALQRRAELADRRNEKAEREAREKEEAESLEKARKRRATTQVTLLAPELSDLALDAEKAEKTWRRLLSLAKQGEDFQKEMEAEIWGTSLEIGELLEEATVDPGEIRSEDGGAMLHRLGTHYRSFERTLRKAQRYGYSSEEALGICKDLYRIAGRLSESAANTQKKLFKCHDVVTVRTSELRMLEKIDAMTQADIESINRTSSDDGKKS